jgi:hypothetical protein
MNRFLILLIFLSTVYAKRSAVDVIYSSHRGAKTDLSDASEQALYSGDSGYESATVLGCRMAALNGDCFGDRCCPSGTLCIQGDTLLGTVNTCRVLGKSVHQGATGYDFEAERIIKPETQVPFLSGFTTVKADAEATEGEADKYPTYKVSLTELNDSDKYTNCTVTLTGSLMDATSSLSSKPEHVSKVFSKVTGEASCEFMVKNKGYLGLIGVNVSFTKNDVLMDIGEKRIDSVEVHLRYVPGADDDEWHDPTSSKWGTAQPELFPDHSRTGTKYASTSDTEADAVFEFEKLGSHVRIGTDSTAASALKGTLRLPVNGTFYDGRYLVVEQTGVESLMSDVGDGHMRKEGMDIHYDFKDFYMASRNTFDNTGIKVQPIALHSHYKAKTGLTNMYAQYRLDHTYVMTYGGSFGNEMPHFSPDYLSCPLCEARVVLKMFSKAGAYDDGTTDFLLRYHGTVDTSTLPTSTNTIELDDVDVVAVQDVDGHVDVNGVSKAVRLPTSKDPQNPDGHPLGDFFTVIKSGTRSFNSLTDPYSVIGDRLTVPLGATASSGCSSGAGGKVYEIRTDIVAKAQELFDESCRIIINATTFGTQIDLEYTKDSTPKDAYIVVNDERQIVSGNTELSILRRKADSQATTNGPRVTFHVSQFGAGAINFTIKGSNTMIGYGNDGSECTDADLLEPVSKQCKGKLDEGENKVSVSAVDGVSTEVTIRSSSDCFLYMDVELQDDNNDFASYGLRLPCVRTTDEESDSLNLTYTFDTSYSLSNDVVTAEIGYEEITEMNLTVADKGVGTCNTDQTIAHSCPSGTTLVWGTANPYESTDLDLAALRQCGSMSETDENYIIQHHLALAYDRNFTEGGRNSVTKYCQSQEFVTTIRRDASASVTVATLVTPTLERSVMVSGISWVQCSSSQVECKGSQDCYKLRIEVESTEKRVDESTWRDSGLKDVFMPPNGVNTDSMSIEHNLTAGAPDKDWALESVCGVVSSCSDGTGTHYGDLSGGTKQDMIIRGVFDNVDVDTAVSVETKFEQCPLQGATDQEGGELLLGLKLDCEEDGQNAAESTVASDVSVGGTVHQNCASAFSSANAKITVDIYLDSKDTTGANGATAWSFKNISYTINRYEKDLVGAKDPSKLITSDLMMKYGHNGAGYDCLPIKSGLTGLANNFDPSVLVCDDHKVFKFDLEPLQPVNMDVFEVEVIAILKNDGLQRRYLRSVYRLRADGSVQEQSTGLTILPAEKDVSDEHGGSVDDIDSNSTDTSELHKHAHTMQTWLIIGVIAGLVLLGIACWACMKCKKGSVPVTNAEKKPLASGGSRSSNPEFKNLRY